MLPHGQFTIRSVRHRGMGGLGTVDEVIVVESNCDYPVGTTLARKRLNSNWKDNPTAQARFDREIKALANMNHRSIVPFKGENLPNKERFYVMPIYARSVRDLIDTYPMGFSWIDVAKLGVEIANAMYYAHQKGYIHRDLKPENLLQDADNHIVISDWGLGYFVHQYSKVLNLTVGPMGTLYYCSAEQWSSGKCDERGDIYSLGVVLAELVRGANRIAVNPGFGLGQEDAVIYNAPGTSEFNEYLRAMTSLFPHDRPSSMADISAALQAFT